MKRYRLLIKYPDCKHIQVGDIVRQDEPDGLYYSEKIFGYSTEVFDKNDVENFPELWEEIKEPLFITEDGVDIYDLQAYITCVFSDFSIGHFTASHKHQVGIPKKFANYENAMNWIKENKPKFSEKQILDAVQISKQRVNILTAGAFGSNGYSDIVIIEDTFLKELEL